MLDDRRAGRGGSQTGAQAHDPVLQNEKVWHFSPHTQPRGKGSRRSARIRAVIPYTVLTSFLILKSQIETTPR